MGDAYKLASPLPDATAAQLRLVRRHEARVAALEQAEEFRRVLEELGEGLGQR